ncbi:MAG: hypothetical protein ACOX3S_10515 [Anaerolineae bacterium]|jgi:hypothetical protein
MENITNEPFLAKRNKLARYASYVGFGSLFVGLLSASRVLWLAYVMLLIGLVAASIGSYLANRYVKEPRADHVLGEALANLDKRYALYNYYFATSHLLLSHFGLTVLDPYPQTGQVSYRGGRWRHKAGIRKVMQLFGDPALGKPHTELKLEIKRVKDWIDENLPGEDIPVTGVIVFTNANVELDAEPGEVAVVKADGLAAFMKDGLKGSRVLSTSQQRQLRKMLDDAISAS